MLFAILGSLNWKRANIWSQISHRKIPLINTPDLSQSIKFVSETCHVDQVYSVCLSVYSW